METNSGADYKKEIDGYMEKPYPHNVLEICKDHPKVNELLSKKGLSVLDIGCRVPEFLFFLYHEKPCFEYFVGVELDSQEKTIAEMRVHYKSIPPTKKIPSVHEFYLDGVNRQPEDYTPPRPKTMTKVDFKKHFDLIYGTHSGLFLYQDIRTFDYLILSNVLHLDSSNQKDYDRYISKLFSKINSGGLIYVKVNHEDNPNSIEHNHRKFNEISFKTLFTEMFEELLFKDVLNDNNTKQSMVYFGVKR